MSSFNQQECLWYGQPCDGYPCTCQQCGFVLTNGICLNCTYGDGKAITCCECEGLLRGRFCLFCNSKAENSFTYDPNAYSFNDTSSNFNTLPQPQYETYLCKLCGNDSHYGYDCPPQFLLVYEQEPSYNQNYNDNYYPHDSSSFICCDNYGGSHATFQCQPMDQNISSSGFDQIQPLQYLVIHHLSQEISEEILQAKESLMKYIQTFLKKFNHISFEEMPKVLSRAWDKFFEIQHAQLEDTNELLQKHLEDLKIISEELEKYINSPSWNRPTFYNNDEEHSIQYKEYLENSSYAKKQKLNKQEQAKVADDDTAELKRCLEIVPKDDDVAIEATPLSSKSPIIVVYKIYREWKKSYFKIIRADKNSQNYLTFGIMLKNFNREDLEVLRRIVKERFKKTKPMDDMDNLLFQTLEIMFEHHIEISTRSSQS
uniref:CCHC-type domain-containing protein n=1 Tax=Tanacetum cinerariifolium TaxID=118510 RepID=A0A6L2JLQ2_TANCI|nr:hypothetical protein [Tanacetum cinerariifolium]